eukprot:6087127-Pleurochrysis_carterae.AAC.2
MSMADIVVGHAESLLAALFAAAGVDESHGLTHAKAVLRHAECALAAAVEPPGPSISLAVRLAALLHDADDKKYFLCSAKTYANARRIMEEATMDVYDEGVINLAVRMISLVSCSANGNNIPADAQSQPEILWPRWADRLEATGLIGVVRCWQYNKMKGDPLYLQSTPRATSEAELWQLATEERFASYQERDGSSASMMDHFYDKLLQVSRPPAEVVRNRWIAFHAIHPHWPLAPSSDAFCGRSYLEREATERAAPIVDFCLKYGKTGTISEDELSNWAKTFCSSEAGMTYS